MINISDVEALLKKSKQIISPAQLDEAFDRMAAEITKKLKGTNPVVLAVMNGALFCTSEIVKRLDFTLQMDYLHVTRYQGKIRAGDLHWRVEPSASLKGRTVLVIDDILDLGLTLGSIIDYCKHQKQAHAVYTAVMLDKQVTRSPGGVAKADFVGLPVENKFLIGSGLDYEGFLRNLPGVHVVEQ